MPGVIVELTGPVSYRVQVSDQIWRCHVDQLLDHSGAVAEVGGITGVSGERASENLSSGSMTSDCSVQSTSGPTPSIEVTALPQNTEHSDSHRCIEPEPDSSTPSVSETVTLKRYPR